MDWQVAGWMLPKNAERQSVGRTRKEENGFIGAGV
jgi:hypothetical protein